MEVVAKTYLSLASILMCLIGRGRQAPTIYGCTDGWVTIEENSRQPITCQELAKATPVNWRIAQPENNTIVFNGSCTPGPACPFDGVTLAKTDTTSLLTILNNRRKYDGFYVVCRETEGGSECSCRIRIENAVHSTTQLDEENTTRGVQPTHSQPIYTPETFSLAGDPTIRNVVSFSTDKVPTTTVGGNGKSLPWAAIGGGVGAAVVIVIIATIVIVIFKRCSGSRKGDGCKNNVLEEHVNMVYELGDRENKHTSAAPQQTAFKTTNVPSKDDHQVDDGEVNMGYSTVHSKPIPATGTVNKTGSSMHKGDNRSASGNVGMTQTNSVPAIRHDLALDETELTDEFDHNYSAVNAPRPKTFAAPSLTSTHGDEYAVVVQRTKGKKGATFQPDVYAQVHKPKPNTAGDVYAEVDKSSKRNNFRVVQQNVDSADGGYYAEVRKPIPGKKPTLAVKPVLKPKPTLQPNSTANPGDGQAEPDEYNALHFGSPAQSVSPGENEQQYSHI